MRLRGSQLCSSTPQLNGIAKKKSRDVTFHEKEVSHHFREPPSNIDMEVSLVYESSLSYEQGKSSVDLISEPIESLQGCSSMSHITHSESFAYVEAIKRQFWNGAIMENDVWKVVLKQQGKSVVTAKWIYMIKLLADIHNYLKLSKNHVFNDRLRHIERKYHYVRDMVQRLWYV